ncbi:MAG TPA: HAD-IA family hydrolase, partial [Candidatus Limnocylindria bacterium]|nr:HAD-IA family hydrolase [Candidatus Limnocylindria bacterium]
ARRTARRDEIVNALDLMAGVRDYLTDARRLGLRIGIASSSTRGWVCGHLERLAVREGWDAIVCREDVQDAKPSPELYQKAVGLLGVAPQEALALEDSPNGIAAAKAAGLRCVAVPNPLTADLDLRQADMRIASLAELSLGELIRRLDGSAV